MKSAGNPDLGRYVVLKRRADGTGRAYFQVPERLRPPGWPATLPLCRDLRLPGRARDLTPPLQGALMVAGAKAYEELQKARQGGDDRPPPRSLKAAVIAWRQSEAWRVLKPKTKDDYEHNIKGILAWSERAGHPDAGTLTRRHCELYLATFNEQRDKDDKLVKPLRQTAKIAALKTLRLIMHQVVALGWRNDNPAVGIKLKRAKTKATIWEQADVDSYVKIARERGLKSVALMLLLEWEIGQRLTDLRGFRPGKEYDSARGVFSFEQSKTDAPVEIEISQALRDLLQELVDDEQLFLFRNERTGKAYTENRLSKVFGQVRTFVVRDGGRPLVMRQLRHSCVVQLARAGCTVPEIASITGHTLSSVQTILTTYLPRDTIVAKNAQVKRGLVKAEAFA